MFLAVSERDRSTTSHALCGGGPAEALAVAARHLNVPADPRALHERFSLHAHPQSALALVEVAPEVGLVARALRGDLAGLLAISLPAVVHLHDPETGEDSFAVLLERGEAGYILENPLSRERLRLPALEFEALWSGVVVTLAPREGGAARPAARGAASRLRARLAKRGPSAPLAAARLVGAACFVLLALATAAGAREAGPGRALAAVGLDVAGVALGFALLLASRRSSVPGAAPRLSSALCGRGKLTDCESVLSSRFARVAGIELSVLGLGFFASSLVLPAAGVVLDAGSRTRLFTWLAVAHLAAVPAALVLIGLQVWPLRRLCLLCMSVHAVILSAAALGAPLLGALNAGATAIADVAPFAALHGVSFLGVLGLVVPFAERGIENRVLWSRLGWVSATPWGALAEVAGQSPAEGVRLDAGLRLSEGDGPFRVDALVHPLCPICPPVIERLRQIARRFPQTLEVLVHVPPRDPRSSADRELCAALTTVGMLAGAEQALFVLKEIKRDPRRWLDTARGGAERVLAQLLREEDINREVLRGAREMVAAADRVNEALRRGVPSLLLNGRLWDAPLEDLDRLLSHHREALAAALGLPPGERERALGS